MWFEKVHSFCSQISRDSVRLEDRLPGLADRVSWLMMNESKWNSTSPATESRSLTWAFEKPLCAELYRNITSSHLAESPALASLTTWIFGKSSNSTERECYNFRMKFSYLAKTFMSFLSKVDPVDQFLPKCHKLLSLSIIFGISREWKEKKSCHLKPSQVGRC